MGTGTILAIGATGGVDRHVVRGAVEAGLCTRALVRSEKRAARRVDRPVHVTLMTQLGVTRHGTEHDRDTGLATWKHRSERLLRASGLPYTIVRPGWFDYEAQDERRLVARQGDDARDGAPSDGAVSREQLPRVLLAAQTSPDAVGRTFELVAERGAEQTCLGELFAPLRADVPGELDGLLDPVSLPLDEEPSNVLADLRAVSSRRRERIAG